jgi:NAD-dependent deacetylase
MTDILSDIIKEGNLVFFGGAGVSTESGIPDFRSEDGVFKAKESYGYPPEMLLSHSLLAREPALVFNYYKNNLVYRDAEPNAAHIKLAELEERGLLRAIVTQNIDGLHEKAGSINVFNLHGSVNENYCVDCGKRFSLDYFLDEKNEKNGIPACDACGGMVRPDVVFYEEGLDDAVMRGAISAIGAADTLIVGGTSLVVYPAASFINYFHGKNLILINKTATPYDNKADLVIRKPIGKVFEDIKIDTFSSM